jgi:Ca2+-binding EF-hand superfamily protein
MSKTKGKKKENPEVHKYRMIFKLYDEDKDSFVDMDLLGEMLRSAGAALLDSEIENIVEKTTKELKDTRFSMKTFEKLCSEYVPYNETEEDLIKAFKFWDKENTGKISVEDLKESLTKIGDVLNNNQMESLIKEADPNETGTIDYYEYAKILIKKL